MAHIYLIGSLRNPAIPGLANQLRAAGHEVFDDWYAAGPEADDHWQKYEQGRGRTMQQALHGKAARNIFAFDERHLVGSDIAVLVLPAGKSAHLELGYMAGRAKHTIVMYPEEPDRWDVMYQFADHVVVGEYELEDLLRGVGGGLMIEGMSDLPIIRRFFPYLYKTYKYRNGYTHIEGHAWGAAVFISGDTVFITESASSNLTAFAIRLKNRILVAIIRGLAL